MQLVGCKIFLTDRSKHTEEQVVTEPPLHLTHTHPTMSKMHEVSHSTCSLPIKPTALTFLFNSFQASRFSHRPLFIQGSPSENRSHIKEALAAQKKHHVKSHSLRCTWQMLSKALYSNQVSLLFWNDHTTPEKLGRGKAWSYSVCWIWTTFFPLRV